MNRVPVHYFEKKKEKAPVVQPRQTQELKIPTSVTRGSFKGSRRRRGPPSEDEITAATDPQIALPMQRLEAWVSGGGSLNGMTRKQIAEMCLFGHKLFEAGRLNEARVVFEEIVALGVDDAFPHSMLGTIYLAQGDLERALPLFETALKLNPKDVAAWVYRGEIRIRSGQNRTGLADLRKAISLAPASDPFAQRAIKVLERLGKKVKSKR